MQSLIAGPRTHALVPGLVAGMLACVIWAIFVGAPEEMTMGPVQRIVYFHVPVAWCALASSVVMGASAVVFLFRGRDHWDHWSRAAAETGWLCTTLTLATGSLWAHEAWNTWWTWEPRLTASLILWTIYAGYFLVRSGVEESDLRSRVCAVLAVLALADIPLIIMATRWLRGIHPVSPEMDPRMRLVLLVSVLGFTAFFMMLAVCRRRQLGLAAEIGALERERRIETCA